MALATIYNTAIPAVPPPVRTAAFLKLGLLAKNCLVSSKIFTPSFVFFVLFSSFSSWLSSFGLGWFSGFCSGLLGGFSSWFSSSVSSWLSFFFSGLFSGSGSWFAGWSWF